MKKILLLTATLVSIQIISQTNAFPNPGPGNVSIGAGGTPTAKLHLLENTPLGAGQNVSQIMTRFGGNSGTAASPNNNIYHNTWLMRSETNSADWWTAKIHDAISLDNAYLTPGTDTKVFWERHPFADRQSWGTGNVPYMTLHQGRLGLGIYNLSARLEIQESNNSFSTFIARNLHTVGGGYCIVSNVKMDQTKALTVVNTGTGWAENFVVYGNGRTKIGLQGPDPNSTHNNAMLSVDGKVIAKSFYVTTAPGIWADYVFEKDYKLMSIGETESYVKKFKHLPGVPTAQEIEKDGINLAETNIQLLEKLEEAYLHIIELNKRMELLESKLKN